MYSIKGTKNIEFNYNISNIRKISDTEYQYHGKPNSPNLVLSNGIKRISYVAERIEMKQKELIIHHSATSNFPKQAMVIFPLVVSKGRVTVIDRLIGMEMNETLDLDIGSEITDYTMEINETQKGAYIIRLSSGLPMSDKPPIIEGACGMTTEQENQLANVVSHLNDKGNPHEHNISKTEFAKLISEWQVENGGDFAVGGAAAAAAAAAPQANQEMECFPTEGKVFNKRFHIIYDDKAVEKFIAEDGVDIRHDDYNKKGENDKLLRDAINAEVKRLKEHIEKLGGIYVANATMPTSFKGGGEARLQKYNYIKSANIKKNANDFVTENEGEIDIFITYVTAQSPAKLRMFSSIDEEGKLLNEDALTKPHQVMECILVAVINGNTPLLMNAKKFSEDYLNKDFNRYTHISIPGYMTDTENMSMKVIIYFLAMMIITIVSYYTVPGLYKIAIKRITRNQRTCGIDTDNKYEYYYKAKAFNYFFTIITVILPILIMIFTDGINGILVAVVSAGLICVLVMITRFKHDGKFFNDFYPRNGITMCNQTKDFRDNEAYGSSFKAFTYIPGSLSALFSS